jgi:hypothetical protein
LGTAKRAENGRLLYVFCRIKNKVSPRAGHQCPDTEQKYSFTLSLSLDGVEWLPP